MSLKEIAEAGDLGGAARPPAVPRQSQELRNNHEILEKTFSMTKQERYTQYEEFSALLISKMTHY